MGNCSLKSPNDCPSILIIFLFFYTFRGGTRIYFIGGRIFFSIFVFSLQGKFRILMGAYPLTYAPTLVTPLYIFPLSPKFYGIVIDTKTFLCSSFYNLVVSQLSILPPLLPSHPLLFHGLILTPYLSTRPLILLCLHELANE